VFKQHLKTICSLKRSAIQKKRRKKKKEDRVPYQLTELKMNKNHRLEILNVCFLITATVSKEDIWRLFLLNEMFDMLWSKCHGEKRKKRKLKKTN